MIRAVFFDFYNTLVSFDPPREELQSVACREFGIEVNREAIRLGYWYADDFMSHENARLAISSRSPQDVLAFWAEYESIILKTTGVDISKELALSVFIRVRQLDRKLILFDDVLPVIRMLKGRNMILGLVSNLSHGIDGHCDELGLANYLDFTLTSSEVGVEKPHAPIFRAALERAGVDASKTIHVGDQYYADVVGAREVGINPLLLDREGFWEKVSDCLRIRSLSEILNYV